MFTVLLFLLLLLSFVVDGYWKVICDRKIIINVINLNACLGMFYPLSICDLKVYKQTFLKRYRERDREGRRVAKN